MPVKREPCRNFQRGSCQYGERCKFLHVVQQQAKPSNPFGFGSGQQQQQQQKPNPFGFGAQSSNQSRGPGGFGTTQQQFKPFENKWSRSENGAGPGASTTKQQADNKRQAANHTCTDPESCKRMIAEDFEQERPIWKLTCYSHSRNGHCDIVGDISYEELRAVAYDDAKRGVNLQSIVERERNLSNSKLAEFQNLIRNPYVPPPGSAFASQSPFPGQASNGFSPTGPSSAPPQVSSFSQLGPSLNMGFAARPTGQVPNNISNQPNLFSSSVQASNPFGVRPPSQVNNPFGQPNSSPFTQNSGAVVANNIPTANSPFGVQNSNQQQQQGSSFPSNTTGFPASASGNPFSSFAASPQNFQSFTQQNPNSLNSVAPSANIQSVNSSGPNNTASSGDMSIWSKTWNPGEIPEEAPPPEYAY
ncbi:unnamed protein product [Linum tenue]|uniref:C3H1-type domain-containing protein n=1 Tax=Linum tenue TaxID=586396 RepID=A0AAV0R874_9ROSI|nr:unnamed protein product [Linum tenue]